MAKQTDVKIRNSARKSAGAKRSKAKTGASKSATSPSKTSSIWHQINVLEARVSSFRKIVASKEAEIVDLQRLRRDRYDYSSLIARKQKALKKAQKGLINASSEVALKKEDLERTIIDERRRIEETLASQNDTIASTAKRVVELEQKLDSLMKSLREEKSTSAFLQKQLSEAHKRIDDLQSSTSWKLTAPVRAFKRWFAAPSLDERLRRDAIPPPLSSWVWKRFVDIDSVEFIGNEPVNDPISLVETSVKQDLDNCFPFIVHAFYPDIFSGLLNRIKQVCPNALIYVTAPANACQTVMGDLRKSGLQYKLYETRNAGRDILPFLSLLDTLKTDGVKVFLKLHTKKSPQLINGSDWRASLYDSLINAEAIAKARDSFNTDETIGILAPAAHILSLPYFIGKNASQIKELACRYGFDPNPGPNELFVAGSMFFGKLSAFDAIIENPLSAENFGDEAGLVDGTLAHGFERIIGIIAGKANMEIRSIEAPGVQPIGLEKETYKYV